MFLCTQKIFDSLGMGAAGLNKKCHLKNKTKKLKLFCNSFRVFLDPFKQFFITSKTSEIIMKVH